MRRYPPPPKIHHPRIESGGKGGKARVVCEDCPFKFPDDEDYGPGIDAGIVARVHAMRGPQRRVNVGRIE